MPTPSDGPAAEFLPFQAALAGRYSIERELGRGGMGIVFLAREVALDRMVALKLLPPELAARPGLKERFLKEARTAARLSHPNIVPIHGVDEVDGFVFFAMAYVDGCTLGDRLRDRGPLTNAEALRLLREVAWALGYAHVNGVIHRDVKPDNILLEEPSGRAMITDFGIAALAEEVGKDGSIEVVGTAEFMSPEQAKGGDVDARSDLYSLGCVGFYALSGRVPFTGPTAAAILAQHLTQPAPPLLSVAPHVAASVAAALDRCLRKEPEHRFSSAEALADALGPESELNSELPAALRVFVRESREFGNTLGLWCMVIFVVPLLVGEVIGKGIGSSPVALSGIFAALAAAPLVIRARQARRLLRSGFTLEDGEHAIARDVVLREEELRCRVDEPSKWEALLLRGLGSSSGTDVRGRSSLRFWKGRIGRGILRLGGLGVKQVGPAAAGVDRTTEIALGRAANRLFEGLPRETRQTLKSLPATVKALEDDARTMREHLEKLDAVLAEIGDDDPSRAGAEERARVRRSVEVTRDGAREKLRQAVKALETIRLGLLMMQAGGATVESLTMDLRDARDISEQMENLLEGHREVERLLQERRRTGVFTLGPEASELPD